MKITIESLEKRGFERYNGEYYIMLSKIFRVRGTIKGSEVAHHFFFNPKSGELAIHQVERVAWLYAYNRNRFVGLCSTKRYTHHHCFYGPSVDGGQDQQFFSNIDFADSRQICTKNLRGKCCKRFPAMLQ